MGECCLDYHNFMKTIEIEITISIPISIPIIPINGGGGFHTGEGCGVRIYGLASPGYDGSSLDGTIDGLGFGRNRGVWTLWN